MTPPTTRPRSALRELHALIAHSWRQVAERVFAPPWRIEATVAEMDEVPPRIRPRRAYLVATPTRHKWLVFDCPCGTGHRLPLNLDDHRRPFWTVRISIRGTLTLRPSVDFDHGHRSCHFLLRQGRVSWVEGPPPAIGLRPAPHDARL